MNFEIGLQEFPHRVTSQESPCQFREIYDLISVIHFTFYIFVFLPRNHAWGPKIQCLWRLASVFKRWKRQLKWQSWFSLSLEQQAFFWIISRNWRRIQIFWHLILFFFGLRFDILFLLLYYLLNNMCSTNTTLILHNQW